MSKADDKYFEITFILCGCIAGILIAVVVIYLCRRNSRSKEKLQQITSGQEGNDAASKDYQVCSLQPNCQRKVFDSNQNQRNEFNLCQI